MKRRYMLGLALATIAAASCRSVPKDAPAVFHETYLEIDQAENENTQKFLPKTMKSADNDFKDSLALLRTSKDQKKYDDETAQATKTAAMQKAETTKKAIQQAREINSRVKAWDENINTYMELASSPIKFGDQIREQHAAIEKLDKDVAALKDTVVSKIDGFAQSAAFPQGLAISKPVAFFNTGDSNLSAGSLNSLQQIAQILKTQQNVKLTLVGHTDPRGQPEFNRVLGRMRATAVADELKRMGVPAEKISVQDVQPGSALTIATGTAEVSNKPGQFQLQRRVDARFETSATTQVTH